MICEKSDILSKPFHPLHALARFLIEPTLAIHAEKARKSVPFITSLDDVKAALFFGSDGLAERTEAIQEFFVANSRPIIHKP